MRVFQQLKIIFQKKTAVKNSDLEQEPIKWSLHLDPIQALGANPFPSRFIIRTVPRVEFGRR